MSERLFPYRGHWIGTIDSSSRFYEFWYDARTRRTRKRSLRTDDFEAAKEELIRRLSARAIEGEDDPLITKVFHRYQVERASGLPSAEPARRGMAVWLEFFDKYDGGNDGQRGFRDAWELSPIPHKKVRVSDFTEARVKAFWRYCHFKLGHAVATIARNTSVAATAMKHCRIPNAPTIQYQATQIAEHLNVPDPEPRDWEPKDEELARILDNTTSEPLFRFLMLSLLTGARPGAVLDMGSWSLTDEGLLQSNPSGRRQNKKFRPTVGIPETLAAWLEEWGPAGRWVIYKSRHGYGQAIRRLCARKAVNVPEFTAYSIRHKVTTILRNAGVPEEKIQVQQGHRRPESRISRGYGKFEAEYFVEVCDALDDYVERLDRITKRSLIPAPATKLRPSSHHVHKAPQLRVVKND